MNQKHGKDDEEVERMTKTNEDDEENVWMEGNWNFRSHVLSLPGAKVPWVELSFPGTFVPWNFRPLELSSPGTFAPESENNVELSLPEWKMACNFHSTPCPKIVCR